MINPKNTDEQFFKWAFIAVLHLEQIGKNPVDTIKTISRFLPKLKAKSNSVYYFCMNCLDCFSEASTIDKHYECYNSNVHVKVNISFEKEKWRKF